MQKTTSSSTHPQVGLSCLKFNPSTDLNWMFAFGCDNGLVRLTSTAYTTDFHQSFTQMNNGHNSVVRGLSWNTFQPDLLAGCSEDNYVKVFQVKKSRPIYQYDLQAPVCSVEWNNKVSTGLIAGTAYNTVHVFDFALDREKALCVQKVVPDSARLTQLSLNQNYPILAVGDTMGIVRIFKLSPNLRKRSVFVPEKKKGQIQVLPPEEQKKKDMELELAKVADYVQWCKKAREANGW